MQAVSVRKIAFPKLNGCQLFLIKESLSSAEKSPSGPIRIFKLMFLCKILNRGWSTGSAIWANKYWFEES